MKNNLTNFVSGLGQVLCTIVISLIMILISKFILRGYFYENAYPVVLDYSEWADLFVSRFVMAAVTAIIISLIFVLLSAFVKGPFVRMSGWCIELVISIAIAVVFTVVFSSEAAEETSCLTIANAMFIIEYVLSFFVGSFFAGHFWKYDYNPILAFFNRRKQH